MRAEHASPLKVEREELVPAGGTDAWVSAGEKKEAHHRKWWLAGGKW
jgi:hypothetical protein